MSRRVLDAAAYERRCAYYAEKGRKRGVAQGALRAGLLIIVAGLVILGILLVASRPAQAATKPPVVAGGGRVAPPSVLGRCTVVPKLHAFKCPDGRDAFVFVKVGVHDGRIVLRTFGLTA